MREVISLIKVFFIGLLARFSYRLGVEKTENKQLKSEVKDNAKANKIRKSNASVSRDDLIDKLLDN